MHSPDLGPTPREVVAHLDQYVIGQASAKRAMAVALRNRARRKAVPEPMRSEIVPKNLLLAGPTGVGKTEIARRVAQMVKAPFLKVEATKFSEVGYMGRDVEGMVRDLVDVAMNLELSLAQEHVRTEAEAVVREQVLECLLERGGVLEAHGFDDGFEAADFEARREAILEAKKEIAGKLDQGELEDELITIYVQESGGGSMEVLSGGGMEDISFQLKNMLPGGPRTVPKTLRIREARKRLLEERLSDLVDHDEVAHRALEKVEQDGVIFLDEIDKVALPGGRGGGGPDVSREGVQRDLLPLVEGTAVRTKYGIVKTDHILFVAAGAFHMSKITDLIPELLGRFPIRVRLRSLEMEDLKRILLETRSSLIRQYKALLATEGIGLTVGEDAAEAMAEYAAEANASNKGRGNLGARRLHAVVERVLEDLLFLAPEEDGTQVHIDRDAVEEALGMVDSDLDEDEDGEE